MYLTPCYHSNPMGLIKSVCCRGFIGLISGSSEKCFFVFLLLLSLLFCLSLLVLFFHLSDFLDVRENLVDTPSFGEHGTKSYGKSKREQTESCLRKRRLEQIIKLTPNSLNE